MTEKKKSALFLAHRIPYPPNKGDKIRSWRIFEYMAKHYDLYAGFFVDDKEDFQHVEYLRSLCKDVKALPLTPTIAKLKSTRGFLSNEPLGLAYYRSGKLSRWVQSVRKNDFAVEVAFSSTMVPYLKGSKSTTVTDMCDADSAKWRSYAESRSGIMSWVYAREGMLLEKYEAEITRETDRTFLISEEEAQVVKAFDGADTSRIDWFGNGVDTQHFKVSPDFDQPECQSDIVFTGAMDYWANVDAVLWFADHIFDAVRAAKPNVKFVIAGANPTPEVLSLQGREGIEVTGRVADMRPWIQGAKIAVAPMRIARGVQNKVLEAMAMERPVIATSYAAEGLKVRNGQDILVEDEPELFVQHILRLLEDEQERASLGNLARQTVKEAYGWGAQLDKLGTYLQQQGVI